MFELQNSQEITLKIFYSIPFDKEINIYGLYLKTGITQVTLKYHLGFLEKIKLISIRKEKSKKSYSYKISLSDLGKKVIKN